jgi:hypothetical protein
MFDVLGVVVVVVDGDYHAWGARSLTSYTISAGCYRDGMM